MPTRETTMIVVALYRAGRIRRGGKPFGLPSEAWRDAADTYGIEWPRELIIDGA